MENYSAERIREDFISPLTRLVGEFAQALDEMERMRRDGVLKKDYLPLNATMPKRALGTLRKLRREITDKLEGVRDGVRVFREDELAKKKTAYAAKSSSKK